MNRYILLFFVSTLSLQADVSKWTHFTIDCPLPGTGWGTAGPSLADYDGDGDLDIALSRRATKTAFWYERVSDSIWIPHIIGSSNSLSTALGNVALDVNHDGFFDVVINQVWFENPGCLDENPDAPWSAHSFEGGGHDIIAADINGDGKDDIVADLGMAWFDTANGLKKSLIYNGLEYHGCIAPKGVGDLDNDGDVDLVVPGHWFANPGEGKGEWKRHDWPHKSIPNASYGTSIRSWVEDLNGDGWKDILYSDCDTGWGHVYWVENHVKDGAWISHPLDDPPTLPGDVPGTGSFHSLGVADFDGDGDLDIFAGEQEDPSDMKGAGTIPMKPAGLKERGIIWENIGSVKNPSFHPVVIQIDNPGWHDIALGDVDGDGDIDIVNKIWNKDGAAYHADYWRNDN